MLPRRSSMAGMDIDSPSGLLQRSNSAPMINDINAEINGASTAGPPLPSSPRDASNCNVFDSASLLRTRRFSASCSPHSTGSGTPRMTPRVSQLRQEECSDLAGREVAHEREVHSAMQMSQSWEDLTLVDGVENSVNTCVSPLSTRPRRVTDPLHVSLPASATLCSSPSPTRGVRHFSPQLPWTNSLSPSPTRKPFTTRRSLSPIAIRPSALGLVKRKMESDDDTSFPPSKRLSCGGGGLLMAQRLSPTSVGTPESISSADSPGFFRPLDSPSPSAQNVPSPCGHSSNASHVDEPMPDETVHNKNIGMTSATTRSDTTPATAVQQT